MNRKTRSLANAGMLTALLSALLAAPGDAAILKEPAELQLAEGVSAASVATFGSNVYVIGGQTTSGVRDSILELKTGNGAVRTMDSELLGPRRDTCAVKVGLDIYIIGGRNSATSSGDYFGLIYRFSPGADTIELVALATPRAGHACVWDGTRILIFGGEDEDGLRDDILAFNPATESVSLLAARLPAPNAYMGAARLNGAAYLFGGIASGEGRSIVKFVHPGTVERLDVELPSGRYRPAAVTIADEHTDCDDGCIYVIGGSHTNATMLRFDPAAGVVTGSLALPSGRQSVAAVAMGPVIYIVGGIRFSATLDDVFRFDPRNQAPAALFSVAIDGLTVSVDAALSSDPENAIVRYSWAWGDGASEDAGSVMSHTFASDGTYTLSLMVVDDHDAVATQSVTVSVAAPPPAPEPPAPEPEPAPSEEPAASDEPAPTESEVPEPTPDPMDELAEEIPAAGNASDAGDEPPMPQGDATPANSDQVLLWMLGAVGTLAVVVAAVLGFALVRGRRRA